LARLGTDGVSAEECETENGGPSQVEATEDPNSDDDENDCEPPISYSEIVKRLRSLGDPVTYFGETAIARYRRLCHIEVSSHEDDVIGGQQNMSLDLLVAKSGTPACPSKRRCRRQSLEDDFWGEDEFGKARGSPTADSGSRNVQNATDGSQQQSGITATGNTSSHTDGKKSHDKTSNEESKLESLTKEDRIRRWVRKILTEWESELHERSEAQKMSADGRMHTAQHRQTRKDLRPLLRKLKQKEVEPPVLDKLHVMIEHCEGREYVSAHDRYIELAIGNSAWPMGVTMVGIHERAGRSKIFSSEIAHILNDETTRKYIQMLKRLMSVCQRLFPAAPSQMVKMSTTHV